MLNCLLNLRLKMKQKETSIIFRKSKNIPKKTGKGNRISPAKVKKLVQKDKEDK